MLVSYIFELIEAFRLVPLFLCVLVIDYALTGESVGFVIACEGVYDAHLHGGEMKKTTDIII